MKKEVEAIFLFIAELTGSFVPGTGTKEDKIEYGRQDYIKNNLPELDLSNEEDRKDLHEVIWLERLYEELDKYFSLPREINQLGRYLATEEGYRTTTYRWTVPIELDAGASLLQYQAVLLNDRRMMEMTNMIGDTLYDPWGIEGLPRNMVKKASTPMLYGSNQACFSLWQSAGIEYTKAHIDLYTAELSSGALGLANQFKDFIINNCNPKSTMTIDIWKDEFEIQCNRFRNVGDKTKAYKIWDSQNERYNTVIHTDTIKIPDLDQFRRYFVTLLVHNLDSQVADTVIGKVVAKYGWGIPIHDAVLISPAAAEDTRNWYAQELEEIHRNRKEILQNYFRSIGVTGAAIAQWEDLKAKVVPFEGELRVNPMALK